MRWLLDWSLTMLQSLLRKAVTLEEELELEPDEEQR